MILSRRLPSSLSSKAGLLRPLSSSSHKTPSLGDIPHSAERTTDFKSRVSAFRKQLAAQKADASPHSLSFTAAATVSSDPESEHKAGIVKSILYGSEKGQKEEAEMEQSYSKLLARGKYVHAIEFHHVKPDKVEEYIKLVGSVYPEIASTKENACHLVGSWKTEVGDGDTFVHIWEYQGYAGYHQTLTRLQNSPTYQHYLRALPAFLNSRKTDLMQEFSFWPTSPPRVLGGIFELRTYVIRPGHLLEWENHWRKGLEARKNVMEGVGAWFTQIGSLNTVHHLWQFADLRERQVAREKSWDERGWSRTVHNTVPLIKKMDSKIMVPLEWSPVR
ncbi:hypothetical protein RUND412_002653 [Rhizina undulata]